MPIYPEWCRYNQFSKYIFSNLCIFPLCAVKCAFLKLVHGWCQLIVTCKLTVCLLELFCSIDSHWLPIVNCPSSMCLLFPCSSFSASSLTCLNSPCLVSSNLYCLVPRVWSSPGPWSQVPAHRHCSLVPPFLLLAVVCCSLSLCYVTHCFHMYMLLSMYVFTSSCCIIFLWMCVLYGYYIIRLYKIHKSAVP